MYIFRYLLIVLILSSVEKSLEAQLFGNTEKRTERYESGAPLFTPIIMPSYTPEMGLAISGGGLLSFKTRMNNPYVGHSVLPVILGVSTKGAFFSRIYFSSYWLDDRLRFNTDFWFENMTDNYWGIGYEKGKNVKKGENTTEYHKNWLKIRPLLLFRIANNLYGGVEADLGKTMATDISDLMKEDEHIINYGTNVLNAGAGLTLNYDSRDIPANARKGLFLKMNGILFSRNLGGDYNYKSYEIDYRHYVKIIRQGSYLTWRINSRITSGQVPWTDMSMLGGLHDLRGYYWGRYRDKSRFFALIEYRHTFSKSTSENLSKHGAVLWFGGGTVFEDISDVKSSVQNVGLGYRYALQPRMNLRIDIGFGEDSAGLYFSINEAF